MTTEAIASPASVHLDSLPTGAAAVPGIVRVYLCGPMTGIPEFNYPAFHATAADLRAAGYDVFNPAEHTGIDTTGMTGHERNPDPSFNLGEVFAVYTNFIALEADAVAVLPDWETSKGAQAEVALARAIGKPVFDALTGDLLDIRTEVVRAEPVRADRSATAPAPLSAADEAALQACMAAHPAGKRAGDGSYLTVAETLDQAESAPAAPVSLAADGSRPGEIGRQTSSTGAQKGTKECRIDLIAPTFLHALGVVLGRGAMKYEMHNWAAGYPTSLSYSALMRHLNAWNFGEDIDEDQGTPHLAAAGFHLMVLLHTSTTKPEFDDRHNWGPIALGDYVLPTPQWLLDAVAAKAEPEAPDALG